MPKRQNTPIVPYPDCSSPDGSSLITVHRSCNGCGRDIGDATPSELDAAMAGLPLPDVTVECGCADDTPRLVLVRGGAS